MTLTTRLAHIAALGGSLAFHACILLLIWLLASHDLRPMQGTAAITVQLVTLAQLPPSPPQAKQEAPPPTPRSEPAMPEKHTVQSSPVKNTPAKPQARAEAAKPQQPWQEAKRDNHGATVTYQPMPKIPDDLRREAFNTYATAQFHVAADGGATVELLAPSQNPRLNRLLLEALKPWRFTPATDDGKPVDSTFTIRVRFAVE